MLNFVPSFAIVSTLAHELGHAHHHDCLMDRTMLQAATPMTLAETASMFCQRLVEEAVLAESSPDQRLTSLDQILMEATGLTLDLHARFNFEAEIFERRSQAPLTVAEFTSIMEAKQRVAYGDGLEAVGKWQWVQKPHYYDTDFHFYNYPYQFGLFFALGLLKVYREEPMGFADRYESLLSRTGMATAADLANDFGIDIRDSAFWMGSVSVLRDDINAFVELANQRTT
jgi:oligoendopeptidase F